MSSTYDSSYHAGKAADALGEKTKCRQGGYCRWEKLGQWPSVWWKCKDCGNTTYSK